MIVELISFEGVFLKCFRDIVSNVFLGEIEFVSVLVVGFKVFDSLVVGFVVIVIVIGVESIVVIFVDSIVIVYYTVVVDCSIS